LSLWARLVATRPRAFLDGLLRRLGLRRKDLTLPPSSSTRPSRSAARRRRPDPQRIRTAGATSSRSALAPSPARHEAEAAPLVRDRGGMTFTSGSGVRAQEATASYVANQALAAMAQGLGSELGPRVRVNVVAPAFMDTAMWRAKPREEIDARMRSYSQVYAVTRAIEIVSEASKKLPDEVRTRHPHMPWRDIRDVGNFYRRQYDNVAESYVWRTAPEHLPPLLAVVLSEIAILDAGA
jgi:uncharacterized protein with HEPN domain